MSSGVVQYLSGLEPESCAKIDKAIHAFEYQFGIKEGCVFVNEFDRFTKSSDHAKRPLAHRYRIALHLGDSSAEWPKNKASYLTLKEVLTTLENLVPVVNLVKSYRIKKAVDRNKRVAHLNAVAAADEKKLAKW